MKKREREESTELSSKSMQSSSGNTNWLDTFKELGARAPGASESLFKVRSSDSHLREIDEQTTKIVSLDSNRLRQMRSEAKVLSIWPARDFSVYIALASSVFDLIRVFTSGKVRIVKSFKSLSQRILSASTLPSNSAISPGWRTSSKLNGTLIFSTELSSLSRSSSPFNARCRRTMSKLLSSPDTYSLTLSTRFRITLALLSRSRIRRRQR